MANGDKTILYVDKVAIDNYIAQGQYVFNTGVYKSVLFAGTTRYDIILQDENTIISSSSDWYNCFNTGISISDSTEVVQINSKDYYKLDSYIRTTGYTYSSGQKLFFAIGGDTMSSYVLAENDFEQTIVEFDYDLNKVTPDYFLWDVTNGVESLKVLYTEPPHKIISEIQYPDETIYDIKDKNALNKSQITNCLLEVPQRIKLKLNDGVLTLKAGSQVIVPNGFEADGTTPKFDYVDVESDVVKNDFKGTQVVFLILNSYGTFSYYQTNQSGSTAPTAPYTLWYDTDNNIVKATNITTDITSSNCSLPLAKITITNNVVTSIDQIFNGMGYIGSTVWVDKGVKGLIPNGRNEDGSFNNVEITTNKITLRNYNSYTLNEYRTLFFASNFTLADSLIFISGSRANRPVTVSTTKAVMYYCEDENVMYYTTGSTTANWKALRVMSIGNFNVTSNGIIASFNPKLPFRAVDYNEFNDVRSEVDGKVSKSGDTMSGPLNFNESPVVHDFTRNSNCYVQRTERITSSSATVESNVYVSGLSIVDDTGYEIAKTEIAKYSDGTIRHNFVAHNINGVGTDWTTIGVGYKPDGTHITYAPNPPTSDNSTQIATTAWVKALPRLIETWESEWFTIAKSQSRSWNLASTGMNATNSIHIKPEIIAKVITADAGYAVGDIVYGQWMNYIGSTGSSEMGSSLCFTGSTLTFSTGNGFSWGYVKKGGGQDGMTSASIQIKIILRRFSN